MFSASGQCVFVESGHDVSQGTWLLLATEGGVLCNSWSKQNKTKQNNSLILSESILRVHLGGEHA